MKNTILLIVASFMLMVLASCTSVTSGDHTTSNITGEAWYVKTTSFLGLPVSTHIFFCPKVTAKGPAKCTEAIVHEGGEGAAASFGAPASGFGAPAAPAQPGFGQPAQPGFGQPAQPGGYSPAPPQPAPQPTPPTPPPSY